MGRLIISAPFGNYLKFKDTIPTLGTFTAKRRGGILWRLWRATASLRYQYRPRAWINKLGLPNPGIDAPISAHIDMSGSVVSVHGFDAEEWFSLIYALKHDILWSAHLPKAVELNLSCPNVGHKPTITSVERAIGYAKDNNFKLIAKLPPVRWFDYGVPLYDLGVRAFHLCNTIWTPGGGLSGKPLKQYSLWAVDEFRQKWGGTVTLIGGGGVTELADIDDYLKAGADHVAIGSGLFNPLRWRKIPGFVSHLLAYNNPNHDFFLRQP